MLAVIALSLPLLCGTTSCTKTADGSARENPAGSAVAPAAPADQPLPPLTDQERAFYQQLGKDAWRYIDANYGKNTGLVAATPDWEHTTLWDIGAQLFAVYSARQIGVITQAEYAKRMTLTLNTLEKLRLYRDMAFNRIYSTSDGSTDVGRGGWSATDMGRFLLALKLIETKDPQFAEQARRIATRNKFDQMTKDGYLLGQMIGDHGKPWTFQEGRIGYEQYVAQGFAQWGAKVDKALTYKQNAEQVKVLGVNLPQDKRYDDRLLSEPVILYAIEMGLNPEMSALGSGLLKAQEARFKQTGNVTIASEDAVGIAPHYFYYYCVLCNRKPFIIDIVTGKANLDKPRWVSTKGALGWHAIMPSDYTKMAFDAVAKAHDPKRGWASGVFEGTGQSTNTYDVNTASVLLEIAAFQLGGRIPLMKQAAPPGT
jgi:hypothetical protein